MASGWAALVTLSTAVHGVVVLQVQRQLVVGAAGVVELRQRGDVARELGPRRPRGSLSAGRTGPTTPSWSSTASPSSVSHTSLSRPVAPSLRASRNALDRVLGRMGPGPAVCEADRRHPEGGEALLHAPDSPRPVLKTPPFAADDAEGHLAPQRDREGTSNDHGHDPSHLHRVR